jgi:hypothetical protein
VIYRCVRRVNDILTKLDDRYTKAIDFIYQTLLFTRFQILEKDIKLEDVPLDLESQQEVKLLEKCKDEKIVFALNVPQLPPTSDGKANTSIVVEADHHQFLELSAIDKDDLKRLGKKIYDSYFDRILEKGHLRLTFPEIQNDLISLHEPPDNIKEVRVFSKFSKN